MASWRSPVSGVLSVFVLAAFATAGSGPGSMQVEWRNARLTVNARNAFLVKILGTVSHQTGVRFVGLDGIHGRVSVGFSAVPLKEGLQMLLGHLDYVISGDASDPHALLVVVMERRAADRDQRNVPQGDKTAGASRASPGPQKPSITTPEQAPPLLDEETLRAAIVSPDAAVQATAFNSWFPVDYQAATAALVEATGNQNSNPQVRVHALQLLEATPHVDVKTVLSALGNALLDSNVEVRIYAVSRLAEHRGDEAIGYLRDALRDSSVLVRMMVIQRVASKKGGRTLIQEAADMDPDESVRDCAVLLLKQFESQPK
ncbi:MAG TPA: HEAT repeat domain-containing protein [Terriglobales bacterium]|nr:HEAT repeat domain-containing protein [Terriglobales bacterium]